MAITRVDWGSGSLNNTTWDGSSTVSTAGWCALTGVQAGDLILFFGGFDGADECGKPTGFTTLNAPTNSNGTGESAAAYYKWADGTETGVGIALNGGGERGAAFAVAYRGVSTADPFDSNSISTQANSTSWSVNIAEPTNDGSMVGVFQSIGRGNSGNSIVTSIPSGFATVYDNENASGGTGVASGSACYIEEIQATKTSRSGNLTVGISAYSGLQQVVVLNAAGAATSTEDRAVTFAGDATFTGIGKAIVPVIERTNIGIGGIGGPIGSPIMGGFPSEDAGEVIEGALTAAGDAQFSITGSAIFSADAAFAADATFGGIGASLADADLTIAGDATFGSVGASIFSGSFDIAGDATFGGIGIAVIAGAVTFAGDATFGAIGAGGGAGAVTFAGDATFSGALIADALTAATFEADATFGGVGTSLVEGAAAFAGDAQFSGALDAIGGMTATWQGDAVFGSIGLSVATGAASFAGDATFTAPAISVAYGSATFEADATFGGVGVASVQAVGEFAGDATFGATIQGIGDMVATWTGESALEIIGYRDLVRSIGRTKLSRGLAKTALHRPASGVHMQRGRTETEVGRPAAETKLTRNRTKTSLG